MGAPGLGIPLKALGGGFLHVLEMEVLGFGVPLGLGLLEFGCLEINDSGH